MPGGGEEVARREAVGRWVRMRVRVELDGCGDVVEVCVICWLVLGWSWSWS